MLAILLCLVPSPSPIKSAHPGCSSTKAPHVGPGRLAELSGQRVATAFPASTGMAPPERIETPESPALNGVRNHTATTSTYQINEGFGAFYSSS
ncbi:hypothetical protein N7533_010679 [Penicillium manginii]|uniref:uncharacterized protein n=1 Tax=Penicillium manginii TaxID=203109 RepID=UPI0025472CC2|nr:uncharacterized protein N7533_010679 [Penicillium manginii]KAJ5741270.1 hypothetical protein N7533_010679 [Penicillium manginii]